MADQDETGGSQAAPEISGDGLRRFIFYRELAEVYLLLDNVSASMNKTLPLAPTANAKGAKATQPDWLEEVCKIGWPPQGSTEELASQAATLMRARDRLNTLAAPATGATIAFTLLVAGEDRNVGGRTKRPDGKIVFWRRWLNALARYQLKTPDDPTLDLPLGTGWGDKAPSRFSLANIAFPNLARPAIRFRRFQWQLVFGLFVWFLATSFLSWNIAAGSALLGQLVANESTTAKTAPTTPEKPPAEKPRAAKPLAPKPLIARLAPARPPAASKPRNAAAGAVPTAANPTIAPPPTGTAAANPDPTNAAGEGASAAVDPCPAGSPCAKQKIDLSTAQYNLQHWLIGWSWLDWIPSLMPPVCSPDTPCPSVNEQWASTLLSVLSGSVLPIFYGVLGAAAAVVRTLSARIKDSTLSPRHKTLFQVQLVLGAVIGGCIGLFVTPSGQTASTTPGLLGSVPLSASALCFIAGFGVEGVFSALDSLLRRVFNMPDPAKPAPASGETPKVVG